MVPAALFLYYGGSKCVQDGEPLNTECRKVPRIRRFDLRRSHGMVFSMATTKITITLQNGQVEAIRALVAGGRAANVSAFVQHAVGVALFDAEGWREMLEDALQQTGGPLTKKERDWADTILATESRKGGVRSEERRVGKECVP